MRLEPGTQLPVRAVRLLRIHYLFVLVVVLLGVLVWVPEAQGRLLPAHWACLIVSLYLWQVSGIYLAGLFETDVAVQPASGFGLALSMPLMGTLLAWGMPEAVRAGVLLVALVWLALIEHLPSQRTRWPAAWLHARRQQTQLLAVALASIAVAVWSVGQVY